MATASAFRPVYSFDGQSPLRAPWDILDQEILPYLTPEIVFGSLRRKRVEGKNILATCPIHGGNEPDSFLIDTQRLDWICFHGCGGGGPIQFLEDTQKLSWFESAQVLAALAGIDPNRIPEWGSHWTDIDFKKHRDLERRSVLLRIFVALTRANLLSTGGKSFREHLAERYRISAENLEAFEVGMHTAAVDIFHVFKRTGLDLTELKTQGLFDPVWNNRLVVPWRDLSGRIVNLIGWDPVSNPESMPDSTEILFGRDLLGSHRTPYQLNLAQGFGKKDLILLDDPLQATLAGNIGLNDPFPVATCGGLTLEQTSILEQFLEGEGTVTLLSNYDPATYGTRLDQARHNLRLLENVSFPVFVVDSRSLCHGKESSPSNPAEFLQQHGLPAFSDLLRLCEVMIAPGRTRIHQRANGRNFFPGPRKTAVEATVDETERQRFQCEESGSQNVLTALMQAAEVIGQRIARSLSHTHHEANATLSTSCSRDLLPDSSQTQPVSFSVERLEERSFAASRMLVSGWQPLDSLGATFKPGELALVGGAPGHGRTSFLVGLLENWLRNGHGKLLFYSFEESELQVYHRLLSLLTARQGRGWPLESLWNRHRQSRRESPDPESLEIAKDCLRGCEGRLQIINRPQWEIRDIEQHLRDSLAVDGYSTVLLDSIDQIDRRSAGGAPASSRTGKSLKNLAVEFDLPVIATITSTSVGNPQNPETPPSSETGDDQSSLPQNPVLVFPPEISEDADLIIGLFTPAAGTAGPAADYPELVPFKVGILKNRSGLSGGWSTLLFAPRYRQIQDPADVSRKDEIKDCEETRTTTGRNPTADCAGEILRREPAGHSGL